MSYNLQYNRIPLNSQLVTDSPKMMLIRKLIVFIVLWLKETSPFVHVAVCTLQWRHNERHWVSNHRHFDCILIACSGADQRIHQHSALLAFVTGEFPAQKASNAENVSIWWRHQAQLEWRKFYVFCISGKRMPNSGCALLNILSICYNSCAVGIHWWLGTSRCHGISGNDNRIQCITEPILVKWQSAILTKKEYWATREDKQHFYQGAGGS